MSHDGIPPPHTPKQFHEFPVIQLEDMFGKCRAALQTGKLGIAKAWYMQASEQLGEYAEEKRLSNESLSVFQAEMRSLFAQLYPEDDIEELREAA